MSINQYLFTSGNELKLKDTVDVGSLPRGFARQLQWPSSTEHPASVRSAAPPALSSCQLAAAENCGISGASVLGT